VTGLVEPILEARGLELVHLEFRAGGKGHLCIYIDKPGGVTLADCEAASRDVSDLLDAYDPVPHSYVLEVSSPGVERPLHKESDFRRFQGETVKIQTVEPVDGRKKFNGTLHEVRNGAVVMLLENGEHVEIPFSRITKAHLWFSA
jgi:ribosome maturation factor RimP